MEKRKNIFFSIFAILIGCLLAVALSEGLLRVVGPQWLKQRMREVGVENTTGVQDGAFGSDKNWPIERDYGRFVKFTPLSKFRVQHYEYDTEANIDQWGGRRTAGSGRSGENQLIPFLGDSFTFGIGVKDDETYVNLLGKRISYPLINLGAPGSCLANHLDIIELRHEELNFPPIYVFNVFTGNDLTNLLIYSPGKQEEKEATKLIPLRDKPSTKVLQSINDFVRNNSLLRKVYFIQFLKSKLLILYNNRLASRGIIQRMDDEVFHVIRKGAHFQEMLDLFEEQLRRMKILSATLHFQPVFVLVPDRHQVDTKLREAKYAYYGIQENEVNIDLANESLREKLADHKIPYIDILDCLREKHKKVPNERIYYTLDNHLTAYGHQVAYECLADGPHETIAAIFRDKLSNN